MPQHSNDAAGASAGNNADSSHDGVTLRHPSGASARIAIHGAQVLSWVDAAGQERLYLSSLAQYADGAAIRGGIPVVFPQFGTGPLPKHGFLRTRRWSLISHLGTSAAFRITDDADTGALWPYSFFVELTVTLAETLTVSLAITNPGESAFSFTAALHNYFAVSDVKQAAVHGLSGLTYTDRTEVGARCVEENADVILTGETDRTYSAGPRRVVISSAIGSSATLVDADGFQDWIVWNPGRGGSASLKDMNAGDYLHMLCVEAGRVSVPVLLAAGATWCGTEVIGAT